MKPHAENEGGGGGKGDRVMVLVHSGPVGPVVVILGPSHTLRLLAFDHVGCKFR